MTWNHPSYILCPGCDTNLILAKNSVGLCTSCRKKAEGKGLRIVGRGIKTRLQKTIIKCKVCHKSFHPNVLQDPRYTWYCPACREKVAPITSGINWLHSLGVDVRDAQSDDQLKSTGERRLRRARRDSGIEEGS